MKVAPGAWRYALPALLAAPFAFIFSTAVSVLTLLAGLSVLAFFRDPERTPPPTGVVSAADGSVSVVREEGERVRLGVFMNVWHVHVIRAPRAGVVREVEHTPGAHKPAFSKDSDRNERVRVRLECRATASGEEPESDDEEWEVTFIAGAFARRIHPYVEPGDELERGERIGHIAFGSRVDVTFPPSVEREQLAVAKGEKTTAGETVILESEPLEA
ncbi:protein sorting system archaetidylserine decarboxylase [Natronobiforma cellulositropha]|uniref:protein sorting system archaetidylserine decarboxylase n=1 Tax=Natronobiforma cellulositropha TaxID=1679076 RepID=UPI0021D5B67A|nr:protein sorting system archaetidylserine decarboxylase [Natronobiforma cellulositropha]